MSEFYARWPGRCERCGEAIEEGDLVHYPDADATQVEHVGCTRVGRRSGTVAEVVCTDCFMVRPCPCDDERETA